MSSRFDTPRAGRKQDTLSERGATSVLSATRKSEKLNLRLAEREISSQDEEKRRIKVYRSHRCRSGARQVARDTQRKAEDVRPPGDGDEEYRGEPTSFSWNML